MSELLMELIASQSSSPTKEDYEKAGKLAVKLGGILSGSAIVNLDTAKDLDVFVPEYKFTVEVLHKVEAGGFQEYFPHKDDWAYEEAYEAGEIVHLYRGPHKINLVIVSSDMWVAYKAAHRFLCASPDTYTAKVSRQNLFIGQKNILHSMLGNPPRSLME